jgi:DNA-binding GntR family transcriptional regulator
MPKKEIQEFTNTLIPNICGLIELSGNVVLKEVVKQAIWDRRDAYLNTLNERTRNENDKTQTNYR